MEDRRYVVCHNEDQARKDAGPIGRRSWRPCGSSSGTGEKSLVGNKGYRKFLQIRRGQISFQLDEAKIEKEARFDGKWVLRTNTDLASSRGGAAVQAVMDGGALGSARPSRCWKRGRFITSATKRSAVTCFAGSWRWCCARSWRSG